MPSVTCGLTAEDRHQLRSRNRMLVSSVGLPFRFLHMCFLQRKKFGCLVVVAAAAATTTAVVRVFRCCEDETTVCLVVECPDNISLSHNASSYPTPSPLYNSPLYFNTTTALNFQCTFDTSYSNQTKYKWYINGEDTNYEGKSFDYYFTKGVYNVMCEASYEVPGCDACRRTSTVPITVEGTMTFVAI